MAGLAEKERLTKQVAWLKQIPVKEMIKLKWIESYRNKAEQLREVLIFFGVTSPEQWEKCWGSIQIDFRKSNTFESNLAAVTAWLRQGEIEAAKINCANYNASQFKAALQQIRALTVEPPEVFQTKVVDLCAAAGVAVVFVPQLPKTRTSGATRWLNPNKALIQLSLRYKTDDHLWFSFFHEAGHILLHGKRDIFLEDKGIETAEKQNKEQEANKFAANLLIPPTELERFIALNRHWSTAGIKQFAKEIGIAPGIVVGRLQHDRVLPRNYGNELKCKLEWV